METRANYALIGAFTLAVIVAAFGFVYWFSGGDKAQRRQPVRIVFSGAVSGLSKGSFVTFNGLRV
ncbi:MAG: MlaD family protein, partial [Microvirga sp.]